MVTGSTLPEDIAATARQLLLRGRNILGCVSPEITQNANPTPCHDPQTSPAARAAASHSPKLQLGGPSISPGPLPSARRPQRLGPLPVPAHRRRCAGAQFLLGPRDRPAFENGFPS